MSTRSLIGRVLPDGRVEYAYCHMMGYPYWNGRILERSWTRPEDIAQLIRASHVSSLPYTPEELRRDTELYMIYEEEKAADGRGGNRGVPHRSPGPVRA